MAKPNPVQKLLDQAASELPESTRAFATFIEAPPEDRAKLAERMHQVEASSDEAYVALVRKVANTFITPFDREDMYEMVERLDDVVDSLDHVTYLVLGFGIEEVPAQFIDTAHDLMRMSDLACSVLGHLKKPKKAEKTWTEINELSSGIDRRSRALLVQILADGADPLAAMRLKTVADSLHDASTRLNEFVRTLVLVAIKET